MIFVCVALVAIWIVLVAILWQLGAIHQSLEHQTSVLRRL